MRTSLTMLLAALLSLGALAVQAQVDVPGVGDVKKAPGDAAGAVKEATDDARDTAKEATDNVRDTARDATDNARDTARDATRDARDTARDATGAVRDATRDARDTTRDATGRARDTARDATGTVRDTVRDATRDARDIGRDVRDTARDVRDNVRETARELRDDADPRDRDDRGFRDRDDRDFRDRDDRDLRVGARARADVRNLRGPDLGLWFTRASNRLLISDISDRGPIAQLGFRENDYIISVNGHSVATEADFVRFLTADDIRNERVRVIVWRNGREQLVWVEPSVLLADDDGAMRSDPLEDYGVVLDDRYHDRIVVWRVIPRSAAFYAGIRAGDAIVAFDGQRVGGPREFVNMVQRVGPGDVAVQVYRNRQYRDLTWDLPRMRATGEARGEFREALRPDLDGDGPLDRRDDRFDRRDDRRDDRSDRIEDRSGDNRSGANIRTGADADVNAGGYGANVDADAGVRTAPATNRPMLLPRLRGR